MQEELIQEFKNGNKRAGDDFYNANINLIKHAFKKYKLESMEEEETFALINQAFAKTMMVYDPTKGKFSTYFMVSAKGNILRHLRDFGNIIRPRRDDFNIRKFTFCDSLDKVIYSEDSSEIYLMDKVGMNDDESQTFVNEAINKLNGTDKEIFILYHIGGVSQLNIGKMFGTTQVQISRSLSRSKASLRLILKEVS